jgi:hypothetical protein
LNGWLGLVRFLVYNGDTCPSNKLAVFVAVKIFDFVVKHSSLQSVQKIASLRFVKKQRRSIQPGSNDIKLFANHNIQMLIINYSIMSVDKAGNLP